MARIRVNTEDLKNKAKDFDSAAEACKRAGDDILAAAMSMPSYDGQLSGPARKAGYEIQKQTRELSTALAGNAESLRKTAQAFEDVDNQTIDILEKNTALMANTPLGGGPGGEEDDSDVKITEETKTEWDGSTTYIKTEERVYPDHSSTCIITQTNTKIFSELEADIWTAKDIVFDALMDLFIGIMLADLGIFTALINFFGISGIGQLLDVFGDLTKHDLPPIEAGDKRVITQVGHIILNADGSSTAVWESKIEIFGADGELKGTMTGTYNTHYP